MSMENSNGWVAAESTKKVLNEWVDSFVQVLESMTGQRPAIDWSTASGSVADLGIVADSGVDENLWWEQSFQGPGDMPVWVVAPRAVWEYAGTETLKAAGLETIEPAEARNTWLEILSQSLSAMATAIGSVLSCETISRAGIERVPAIELRDWISVQIRTADSALAPFFVGLSPNLVASLSSPSPDTEESQNEPATMNALLPELNPEQSSRTMDLLMDVDLPVSISFGKAQLPLKEVLKLTTGSIVELNRGVNEQVEVLVNQHLIARGEVVAVEGNYGVRILEIASRKDRLRSIK